MIKMSKLVLIAALPAVLFGAFAIGSAPALAQSRSHYGSPLPRYYSAEGEQIWGSWAPPAKDQNVTPLHDSLYLSARSTRRHTAPLPKNR